MATLEDLRRWVAQVFEQFGFPIILFAIIYFGLKYWDKPGTFNPHLKNETLMPCDMPVQNETIIKVKHLKAYMVGSYIEHRQRLKLIRTIAIVSRSEENMYNCLLCCDGQKISIAATCDIHSDHFDFEYGTADITCKIPDMCTNPTHVAITSRSPEEDESSQDIHILQPVRNQQKQEVFPYKFTVCISTMFDYWNVLMLVQAMEMFKILGVQKVAIYKTNCNKDIQKVLDYYIGQNFVEIIPWTIGSYINVSRSWKKSESPGDLEYFGQIAALNDCVYRYMYQSHYVALQDLDEIILPLNKKNWIELLPELERKYNQNGGFEFENNFFPLSIRDSSSKYSPDSWKKVVGVNFLEHIIRISNDPNKPNNVKVIINPRLVYKATVHGLLESIKGTVRVDPQIARMYHFRDIPEEIVRERSQIQDAHLRDYMDSLIPAVSTVLQQALEITKKEN